VGDRTVGTRGTNDLAIGINPLSLLNGRLWDVINEKFGGAAVGEMVRDPVMGEGRMRVDVFLCGAKYHVIK